jgi:hypothetical protein
VAIGTDVGITIGVAVGNGVGNETGVTVGTDVGIAIGVAVGNGVGNETGVTVGRGPGRPSMVCFILSSTYLSISSTDGPHANAKGNRQRSVILKNLIENSSNTSLNIRYKNTPEN